jgi:TP901 family phage tail tape measure protein
LADLKKTIDIILNGQDKASKQIRQVGDSIDGLNTRFGGVAKHGAAAAAAIAAVGAGITALVGAGLKQAYDQAVDFETAMVDLEKVLGDHPDKLDAAKTSAMDLSNQYGVSSKQIVESIANWVQAGYDVEEATLLAEESIALMYASELNAAEATDTLVKMLKGFKIEVEDTRSKLDTINEVSENYATSVGDLSEALSKVGPVAEAMGFSMEEIVAVLTPAIESFQNGREVGNGFRTVLNKLTDDAKPTQEALDALGVSQRDSNGELKSGRDILFEVGEAFQDLNPSQKTFVAQQIAGQEQSAKFLATMNSWDKVGAVYETAINSAGSVTEELQAKLDSAEKQLDRWNEAWTNLSVVIGDQFKIAATEAVEGGTDIVNALQTSVDEGALDPFFSMLNELAEGLSEELEAIAEAMPEAMEGVDWEPLADSIRNVGEAFGGLFDGLDLATPEGLAEAIQRIVNSSSAFIDFFANAVKVMEPVVEVVMVLIDAFNDLVDSVSVVWNTIESTIGLASAGIVEALQGILEAMSYIPGLDFSDQISSLENFQTQINQRVESALDDASSAAERFSGNVNDIPDEKKVDAEVDDKGTSEEVKKNVDELPEKKAVGVTIDDNDTAEDIQRKLDDMQDQDADVNVDDKGTAEETKDKIDDKIPAEKKLEIEADIKMAEIEKEISEIEAQAETMQTAMEWTAKVDIAQAEASMEKFKSAMEGATRSVESTAESTSSLFETWFGGGDQSFTQSWAIEDAIDQQLAVQEQAAEDQHRLIEEQIKAMQARREAMEQGEGLIQIEAQGLEPELEAFLWKILEKVQVRANEEASEFLLGINS